MSYKYKDDIKRILFEEYRMVNSNVVNEAFRQRDELNEVYRKAEVFDQIIEISEECDNHMDFGDEIDAVIRSYKEDF